MPKFVETVLKNGPSFMESAQRNPKGAMVLLIFVLLVLFTVGLAMIYGASKFALAFL